MVHKDDTIEKASKGFIKDWYSAQKLLISKKQGNGVLPEFDRNKALEAIRKDYAVQTALNILVDKSLENGYTIFGEHDKSNIDEFEKIRKKTRFDRQLRQWFYQVYGYQNCFIENIKDGFNKPKELHTLETTQTEPVLDQHGTVIAYTQIIPNASDNPPTWSPDEVTHIKLNTLTTAGWSDLDIQSIYTSVLIKQYIMKYLGWITGSNQLRPILNFKEASDDDVVEFLSYLKKAYDNIEVPLPMKGEVEKITLADLSEGEILLRIMDKMDENIYSVMHVPPIASNETGQSNRSSADKQEQMLSMRVKAVQHVFKEAFENDLFPKMGFPNIRINFKSPIKNDIGKMMEVAERMKTIGIKTELIEKFLIDEGFYNEKEIFDKKKLKAEMDGLNPKKSEDMFPSRKRKPEDEISKEIGTGDNSSTRQDQLVEKAYSGVTILDLEQETSFNQYPYVME